MFSYRGFFCVVGRDKNGNEVDGLEIMIKNVVREHHWPPSEVGGLFVDSNPLDGIIYWNADVQTVNKELTASMPKKKDKK